MAICVVLRVMRVRSSLESWAESTLSKDGMRLSTGALPGTDGCIIGISIMGGLGAWYVYGAERTASLETGVERSGLRHTIGSSMADNQAQRRRRTRLPTTLLRALASPTLRWKLEIDRVPGEAGRWPA